MLAPFTMRCLSKSPTSVVRVVAVMFSCVLWINPSIALEKIRVVRDVLILEGRIDAGDYASVRSFLSDPSNFNKMNGQVFLASPGGNVGEALQIGYLIRRLRLTTDVPSRPPPTVRTSGSEIIRPLDLTNPRHYLCTSACFLLYVAGIYREFVWAGRLGLHRPQLEYKPGWATEKDTAMVTADMHARLKSYLEEMNVPNKYLELMYSVPPTEVRLITQTELNADLKGYIPEFRHILEGKCNLKRDTNTEESTETRKCVAQTKIELRNEAWKKIFLSSM
jgi:hypothetical protein